MRFVHNNLRDHVASQKNDHGHLYWRYGTSERRSCPRISIYEIFGIVRFSTFSTVSELFGPPAMSGSAEGEMTSDQLDPARKGEFPAISSI